MSGETRTSEPTDPEQQRSRWLLGLIPLALIIATLVALLTVGGNTLPERLGPPIEEVAVERTELRPGEIDLTVRNTGPDTMSIAQIFVNDAYVDYTTTGNELRPKRAHTFTLDYPWQQDYPYLVTFVSATGVTIEHEIAAAVETPRAGWSFYGLMILLGVYVGVIPVLLGMLFLPFLAQIGGHWVRFFLAITVGLLGFLAMDAYIEGSEIGEASGGAFGGVELLFLGAALAYFALVALDRYIGNRRETAEQAGASGMRLALMVAIGIGLHNFGEGLAIGSAYAIGELALGAFLVFGFALHNTTEGLAIVAPLSKGQRRPELVKLLGLGLTAGAPAILGAFVGASAFNAELATLLLGVGIGAIIQVIVQLVPSIKDRAGRALYPLSIGGLLIGVAIMYLTSLVVTA